MLATKYFALNPRSAARLEPIDSHSLVHMPVNALGNQATTTVSWSLKSRSRYQRPSDPGSSKSGARSPFLNRGASRSPRPDATLTRPTAIAAAVVAIIRITRSGRTCPPNPCHSSQSHALHQKLYFSLFHRARRFFKFADRLLGAVGVDRSRSD